MSDSPIQQQISQAKNQLEAMIDLQPSIMLLLDPSGMVLRANRPALEFLRADSFADLLGRHVTTVFGLSAPALLPALLAEPCGTSAEVEVPAPDGRGKPVPMEFTAIRRSAQEPFVVLLARDLREERKARRLLEQKSKAEMAQALIGGLMHKINQPLTVITVRAQLLHMAIDRKELTPAEVKYGLNEIMELAGDVSATIGAMQSPRNLDTEEYTPGLRIVNIDKAAGDKRTAMDGPGMMRLLMEALNAHVPDMINHATRTAEGAEWFARKIGLDDETVATIERAALFHDIGKLVVPAWLLVKTTPLDKDERGIIQRHAAYGFQLMSAFPELQQEAAIVHAHHERYDGKGYPRKLKGTNIPLGARIIMLAEMFEVMYFGRTYRYATSTAAILDEVRAAIGTQVDPELGQVLLTHYAEIEQRFARYAEDRRMPGELSEDEEP